MSLTFFQIDFFYVPASSAQFGCHLIAIVQATQNQIHPPSFLPADTPPISVAHTYDRLFLMFKAEVELLWTCTGKKPYQRGTSKVASRIGILILGGDVPTPWP